jgi:predicted esterase
VRVGAAILGAAAAAIACGQARAAGLEHAGVEGHALERADVAGPDGVWSGVAWAAMDAPRAPGVWRVRVRWRGGAAVEIPHCAGRGRVVVDGTDLASGPGPRVVALAPGDGTHEARLDVKVSKYEKRVACSDPLRVGVARRTSRGLTRVRFASPSQARGGGEAVVFVPPARDLEKKGPLLVGVHPWNGTPWTYAAYHELIDEARARDVALLMPSGLGNSLYVREAEQEVMRAIDAAGRLLRVDEARTSLWGASMGGAGATTIGFHRPDRFALVVSYFGDAKYDLGGYVRSILHDEAGAKLVNALDVIDNARHVPVWLIHGEADRSSPVVQSQMLYDALKARGYTVDFDRVPDAEHEGPLVARFARRVVERAATATAPAHPARVSFRSVRAEDTRAYGVRISRPVAGDHEAFVDLVARGAELHVLRAEGVSALSLAAGALGLEPHAKVVYATASRPPVTWEAP